MDEPFHIFRATKAAHDIEGIHAMEIMGGQVSCFGVEVQIRLVRRQCALER